MASSRYGLTYDEAELVKEMLSSDAYRLFMRSVMNDYLKTCQNRLLSTSSSDDKILVANKLKLEAINELLNYLRNLKPVHLADEDGN